MLTRNDHWQLGDNMCGLGTSYIHWKVTYICCRYEGIILKSRSDLTLLCISSTFISTVFESSQYSALAIGVEIDAFEDF